MKALSIIHTEKANGKAKDKQTANNTASVSSLFYLSMPRVSGVETRMKGQNKGENGFYLFLHSVHVEDWSD